MPSVRRRTNGTYELRVIHASLPKPFYATLDDETEALDYGRRLEAALNAGIVPPELAERTGDVRQMPVSQMLGIYLKDAPIAKSDRPVVEMLQENLTVTVTGITVLWTDNWIKAMKRQARLSPGTIRKRVESLARAVDWWNRREHIDAVNPLRTLPRGYSSYLDSDVAEGQEARYDAARDRRLHPGEPERIEAAVLGVKRVDRQRPLDLEHAADFLLMWRLIASTGLRLREAYRLRESDVRFDLKTIHVPRSKTGRPRDIPMTRQVHDWLKAHPMNSPLVFRLWDGDDSEEALKRTSNRLSQQFKRVFEYAGCDDLTEHDLRHEATCRWMMLRDDAGRWLFRPEEVRRITGHKSVQTFERYLSLRGSDLADRLWEGGQSPAATA